jgi:hypothetical protein
MRQLRDDTHLILDDEVRVYRRERSKRWQAAFNIDGLTNTVVLMWGAATVLWTLCSRIFGGTRCVTLCLGLLVGHGVWGY